MTRDPYNAETDELGLLGCCLIGSVDTAIDAVAQITPAMVHSDLVRESLLLVGSLASEGKQASLDLMAKAWAKAHGKLPVPHDLWAKACDICPSEHNLPYHAQGVIEAHQRRKLRDSGQKLIRDSGNPSISFDVAVADLEAGIAADDHAMPATNTAKTVVRAFIDDTQTRVQRKGELSGITTGFPSLDSMTDGIQLGEMFIIAARPSIGKTAIAVSIAQSACVNFQVPTLFITCEMSEKALMRRLISSVSSVALRDLKTGELSDEQMRKVSAASSKVSKSPLHFLDVSQGASVATICAAVRRAVRRYQIKLVILDYLQKVKASERHEKRTYEVGDVSSKLKACASSTGAAMVTLAQLNRESEKDKGRAPRLADLADSGQIERDADTVCLLDRNRAESVGEAKLIVAKQRDGECGIVPLFYCGTYCRFTQSESNHHDQNT